MSESVSPEAQALQENQEYQQLIASIAEAIKKVVTSAYYGGINQEYKDQTDTRTRDDSLPVSANISTIDDQGKRHKEVFSLSPMAESLINPDDNSEHFDDSRKEVVARYYDAQLGEENDRQAEYSVEILGDMTVIETVSSRDDEGRLTSVRNEVDSLEDAVRITHFMQQKSDQFVDNHPAKNDTPR